MSHKIITNAKELRGNQTDAESVLWYNLRARRLLNYKFRRQVPISEKYIVDFLCYEAGLVVEVDGGQHLDQADYDAKRSCWLESQGFRVARYWNHEVLSQTDAVLNDICLKLNGPLPIPLPHLEKQL
jgi:very-short-patch-repair endonuclease